MVVAYLVPWDLWVRWSNKDVTPPVECRLQKAVPIRSKFELSQRYVDCSVVL